MANLIEAIQRECKRVREDLMPEYQAIGPAGSLALALMNLEITTAEHRIAMGDTVGMITSLQSLREFKL